MDKIIIDGVDVSECLSFDDCNGHNICCYLDTREDEIPFANFCEENKDCYFKQLKRAERENKRLLEIINAKSTFEIEKLKEQLHTKEQKCLTLINENNRLREENDLLAILLEGKNNQYDWAKQKCEELKDKNNYIEEYIKTVETSRNELEQESDKYKQALKEIERKCLCRITLKKDILDIINEAKEQ